MKKGYIIDMDDIVVSYFANKNEFDKIIRDNCHDRYEIICPFSCLGSCAIEGNEHILNQRSLLLIPPLAFRIHNLVEQIDFEGYSIRFSRQVISEKIRSMLDKITSCGENIGRYYPSNIVPDALIDIFRRFDDAFHLPTVEQRAFLETLVCEAIIFMSALDGNVILHKENELGARVVKYLNSNVEKNISLDNLANKFFVSKYHLCRAFKKYSGASVHAYINKKRIMYAKQLIESGETASGAAEKIGFGDYSAFYRAYFKMIGKSPTKEQRRGAEDEI